MKQCQSCEKEFEPKSRVQKYCSHQCINKGRKHTEEWKRQMSERNSGAGNPFFGHKHDEETLRVMSQKSSDGLKNLTSEKRQLWLQRISENVSGENNPFFGHKHDEETRQRMSASRAQGIAEGRIHAQRGIKGWYMSSKMNEKFYFDSFYEYLRMQLLDVDDKISEWTKRHGIKIQYEFMEQKRFYVPDFLITYEKTQTIEEVKGYENLDKKIAKFHALASYANEKNIQARVLECDELSVLVYAYWNKSILQLRKEFIACRNVVAS